MAKKRRKLDNSHPQPQVVQMKCDICNDKAIWPNEEESHNNGKEHKRRVEIEEHLDDLQAYWIGKYFFLIFLKALYII
jgi:hypothetical protein